MMQVPMSFEQVESIKEIGDLVTKMKRSGDGIGLHVIDQELQTKA